MPTGNCFQTTGTNPPILLSFLDRNSSYRENLKRLRDLIELLERKTWIRYTQGTPSPIGADCAKEEDSITTLLRDFGTTNKWTANALDELAFIVDQI